MEAFYRSWLSGVMRGMSSRVRHPRSSLSSQRSKRLSSVMRGMSSGCAIQGQAWAARDPKDSAVWCVEWGPGCAIQGQAWAAKDPKDSAVWCVEWVPGCAIQGQAWAARDPKDSAVWCVEWVPGCAIQGQAWAARNPKDSAVWCVEWVPGCAMQGQAWAARNPKATANHTACILVTRSKLVFLQQQPSKNRCTCTCTFMGPNFRISSSRPHRLFFRWNGRKIGVKRVKRRPRQSYLLSLAHTPNTNEQKQGNTKKRKSRKSLQERRKWCNQKNNLPISSSPPSPQELLQAPIPSNSFLTSSFTSSSLEHRNQHANMWTNNTQTYNDKALHHVLRLRHPWIWSRWYREAMREEHWARPVRWW